MLLAQLTMIQFWNSPGGGESHALLTGLHSQVLQSQEGAAILQVAVLEHLPVGRHFSNLCHALILLISVTQGLPELYWPPG